MKNPSLQRIGQAMGVLLLGCASWAFMPPPLPLQSPTVDTEFFDDMLVAKEAIESYPGRSRFGAVKLNAKLWPEGVLPVTFPSDIRPEQRTQFFEACAIWSKVANVRCVEGEYQGRSLTVMNHRLGCWALWGMGTHYLFFRRLMNLQSECWRQDVILHELGHAFGLIHEHQRPDRDQHVSILPENASGGFLGLNLVFNFHEQDARALTPYDFLSIMHYARNAFSKNGLDTIVPSARFADMIDRMGHAWSISEGDAASLAALYGPPIAR